MRKSRMFHLDRDMPIRTWNPVGGCKHHCYGDGCWAARQAPRIPRYDGGFDHPKLFEHELNKRFSGDVVVFVSSMGDLFGSWVPSSWIYQVINTMKQSPDVTFFLETKNPRRYFEFLDNLPKNVILSTTIETNRDYQVSKAPPVDERHKAMVVLRRRGLWVTTRFSEPQRISRSYSFPAIGQPRILHVSIEPIMDFDLEVLVEWMHEINPDMVSVGYDNWNCKLPEPPLDKTMALIDQLERFTKVERKTLREADK